MVQFRMNPSDFYVFVAGSHLVTCVRREVGDWFLYCSCGDNWTMDGRMCEAHVAEASRAHAIAKNNEQYLQAFPEGFRFIMQIDEALERVLALADSETDTASPGLAGAIMLLGKAHDEFTAYLEKLAASVGEAAVRQ